MKFTFRPKHIKRYREIAGLLLKFGLSEFVRSSGLEELLGEDLGRLARKAHPDPRELASELERMGPTFVKLGQVLSTRADLIPLAYLDALAQLQDKVEPFSFEEVEEIVQEELGQKLSNAFATFEPKPLAAASIGQVHKATLADGREVAVKVQRPGIRARLADDLEVLDEVAGMLEALTEFAQRYEFRRIVDDFRRTLLQELDYRTEARNLRTLADNLVDFDRIVVPRPVEELTSQRLLVMDFIRGRKVTDASTEERERLAGPALAEELLRAYIKQICLDGFFHADPHPGNVFLTDDGKVALLDLGMVAHIPAPMRERLLRLLLAVGEGNAEEAADIAVRIGQARKDFQETAFRHRIMDLTAAQQGRSVEEIQLGRVVLEIAQAAGENGLRVPRELTMLGKALLNLDQLGRALAPDFDPYASIRKGASRLMVKLMAESASPANLMARLMEVNEFTQRLPSRVNKILDRVAENRLEFKVRSFDERELIEGFQKVANRIAMGLVVAAMVVGASMLMTIKTRFEIFGYPGLAILLFLAAAGGGVALILEILKHDRKRKR